MTAENESAPAAEPVEGVAPEPVRTLRSRLRPLLFAYGVVFVGFGALAGAIAVLGSAADGSPGISVQLKSFPSPAEVALMKPGAFHDTRDVGGNLVADPSLIEDSPQGPLPRLARDGRAPMTAYGRSFDRNDKRPRIAIVIRGLGVGSGNTELALTQLAPDVTLAFTPFGLDLQSDIDRARSGGHEVLLEVPMEPFDFPDSDPGPHALLAAASAEENAKRLEWTLTRATGYVGVMNLLGGRFMGEASAIEPVLDRVARRGLLFFDNGASSNAVTITSARHVKAPIATGTLMLDAVQTPAGIDSKLAELENAARQDGFAIGVASAYPVTIARITEWLANAPARGFQPVPLTALAARPADVAAAEPAAAPARRKIVAAPARQKTVAAPAHQKTVAKH